MVRLLRGTPKPLFVVINKIDTPKVETLVADFYQLGTGRSILSLRSMASASPTS